VAQSHNVPSPRVALVTGGGTGIGAATARRLAAGGYVVVVTGRRPEPIEAVAAEVEGLAIVADMSVPTEVEGVVQHVADRCGGLDALVVNAGVGGSGTLTEMTVDDFERVVRVNLTGAFAVARAAIPYLLERRGAVVTVASAAALRAAPASLAYCSSKAALAMLTQCIALDHGPDGVRANCVCPGWVRTPMADGEMDWLGEQLATSREDAYVQVTADVPLRRPSTPEEIAGAVTWLLSSDASYVNGAVIPVDGGHTMVDVGTLAFGKVG
jgi:meso-butanediol dehydrogenase/(S,S)-butanediol dehydrogenase/diacetyl reductase